MADASEAPIHTETSMTSEDAAMVAVSPNDPNAEHELDEEPHGQEEVNMNGFDCTLNCCVSESSRLATMTSDDFKLLYAACRADHGVLPGARAYFEMKAFELTNSRSERIALRVGWARLDSHLVVGADEKSCGFDISGGFFRDGKRVKDFCKRVNVQDTFGLLINLQPGHVNENTVSLFINGVRHCKPTKLPQALVGHALYPCVTFRSVGILANCGNSSIWNPLKFKPNFVSEIPSKFLEKSPVVKPQQCEFIMPIGIPDEGTYDVVDFMMQKDPGVYTEISNRMLFEFAQLAGVRNAKGPVDKSHCNDKPCMQSDIQVLDDYSAVRTFLSLASNSHRRLIIGSAVNNLFSGFRSDLCKKITGKHYKKVALVHLGDPPADFAREQQKKFQVIQQKTLDMNVQTERTKLNKERADKRVEAQKKYHHAKSAWDEKKNKDPEFDEPEPDQPMLEEDVPVDEAIPDRIAELDPNVKFNTTRTVPDATPQMLAKMFHKFSLPTAEEGFDEVRYVWNNQTISQDYFDEWSRKMKLQYFISFKKGDAFQSQQKLWQEASKEYQQKQKKWKSEHAKNQASKAATEAKEGEDEPEPEQKIEDKMEEVDPWGVDDVDDAIDGAPLYALWTEHDFRVATIRHDLNAMFHCFKVDVNDDKHPGIAKKTFPEYFHMYFSKPWDPGHGGCQDEDAFWQKMSDIICLDEDTGLLEPQQDSLDVPMDVFVKATEEARRERILAIEAGDNDAKLNFAIKAVVAPPPQSGGYHNSSHIDNSNRNMHSSQSKGYGKGKGKKGGYNRGGYQQQPPPSGGHQQGGYKRPYQGGPNNYPPSARPRANPNYGSY